MEEGAQEAGEHQHEGKRRQHDKEDDGNGDVPNKGKSGKGAGRKSLGGILTTLLIVILAVLALGISGWVFYLTKATQEKLAEASAKIAELNGRLAATGDALLKFQGTVMQEKAALAEERKKRDDLDKLIIQNISQLQTKARISPTLAKSLETPAPSDPAVPDPQAVQSGKVVKAAPLRVPEKSPATPPPAAKKQPPQQVEDIKNAIKRYNAQ